MSSININQLPNDALVRINQYLTKDDLSLITNRELFTHLHSEIYEQIQAQEENSIFRVALQRIDDKHPGWSQGVKVALCLRGVIQALQMGGYYLTSKQKQSLQIANVGWTHPDIEAIYGKKIQKSVLELCIAEKNLMGKMISENRAYALIAFFEDLMKKLPPEMQFELPPELPPREQARVIRGWMHLNRDFLSDPSRDFAFIAYVESHEYKLPAESCVLYPNLSSRAKERLIRSMCKGLQNEPLTYLLKNFPTQIVNDGITTVIEIFRSSCLVDPDYCDLEFAKKVSKHPDFTTHPYSYTIREIDPNYSEEQMTKDIDNGICDFPEVDTIVTVDWFKNLVIDCAVTLRRSRVFQFLLSLPQAGRLDPNALLSEINAKVEEVRIAERTIDPRNSLIRIIQKSPIGHKLEAPRQEEPFLAPPPAALRD